MGDVPSSISLLHSLHKIVSYSEMSIMPSSSSAPSSSASSSTSSSLSSRSIYPKRLAAFDFDHTITNDNTDTVVRSLLKSSTAYQSELEKIADTHGWTYYMQEIFKLLHKQKIKSEQIKRTIHDIQEVPGMVKCLKTLHSKYNFDLIIISDSNSEFINEWNHRNGITKLFTKIYTNPAEFNDNDLLIIKPYHQQNECNLSAINLCKGKILYDYIKECENDRNLFYENIFYIGDGINDICPILKLHRNDYGCPRINYSLEKKLKKFANKIEAQLIPWENGSDLLDKILIRIQ